MVPETGLEDAAPKLPTEAAGGPLGARTSVVQAVLAAALAVAVFLVSDGYPPSAARAPQFVAVVTVCLAVVVAARDVIRLTAAVRGGELTLRRLGDLTDSLNIGLVMGAATGVYLVLFLVVGFPVATAAYAIAGGYLLGYRRSRWRLLLFGVTTSAVLYLVFTKLFAVRLPLWGLL